MYVCRCILHRPWLMGSAPALTGGVGGLSGEPSASGLGLQGGCGQSSPLRPVGSWAGARDREPAKSSQYLLLLYLLAVWLDPEGPPELLSCSEALGRSPSLQWPHLPAPQSNQPAAGRGGRGSQESVSGQGRGGSYIQVLTCLPELGCGGRECMGLE